MIIKVKARVPLFSLTVENWSGLLLVFTTEFMKEYMN